MLVRVHHSLALLGLLACTPPTPAASDQTAKQVGPPPPTVGEPISTPAVPPRAADPAGPRTYVAVETAGVFVIDERGWQLHHTARETIRDMLEHDGALFVLSSTGVARVSGLGAASIVAPLDRSSYPALGEPRALAMSGATAWVVGDRGVGRFAGQWTITPWTELGGQPSTRDVAVDVDATAWLAGDVLRRFDGTAWIAAEPATPALALTPLGDALLLHTTCATADAHKTCSVQRRTREQTVTLALDTTGCPDDRLLAVSPNGRHAALVGGCGLLRFDPTTATGSGQRLPFADDGVAIEPTALALDDDGRAWIGSGRGLTVVGPEPGQVQQLPLARLTDIGAPVAGVLLTGRGPSLPTLGSERRGGLRAKLVDVDGQPFADAPVELCRGRLLPSTRDPVTGAAPDDPTSSPCAGVEPTVRVTTDANGAFEANELALGSQLIAVQRDGRWLTARPKALTMRAGMTGNVGKLVAGP